MFQEKWVRKSQVSLILGYSLRIFRRGGPFPKNYFVASPRGGRGEDHRSKSSGNKQPLVQIHPC